MTVLEYKPRQQIAVKFSEELKTGQQCVLIFNYSANLSHTYDGFYNSSYTDKDGNKRYISTSIFVLRLRAVDIYGIVMKTKCCEDNN